jgi:propionyl-CoA synthetase
MPGFRLRIVDAAGDTLPSGIEGSVVIDQPLPPGTLVGLWNAPDRFVRSYFEDVPGSHLTGDAGYLNENGQLVVLGRADDIINVAGHRLSTGTIEGAILGHPDVIECAVVGAPDPLKGEVPLAFVVGLSTAADSAGRLDHEVTAAVRNEVGAIAAPQNVVSVTRLPKTRSGKILRATLREMVAGGEPALPPTIEDPEVLNEIAEALRQLRPAKQRS